MEGDDLFRKALRKSRVSPPSEKQRVTQKDDLKAGGNSEKKKKMQKKN